uniref:Variant surface glycoprotein 478 n=1 Tax=Trypanosoma brucei TaxID=5691 RepID=M4T1T5_9TRYP|nr:variant surface glycoprotein 478 [Trypanosoma brucei]
MYNSKKMHLQTKIAALTVVIFNAAADTPAEEAAKAANDACKAIWFLDNLAEHLEQQLRQAEDHANKLRNEAEQLEIAYISSDFKQRKLGYGLLLAATIDALQQTEASIADNAGEYSEAARQLRNVSATITAANRFQLRQESKTHVGTAATTLAGIAGDAGKSCKYEAYEEQAGYTHCAFPPANQEKLHKNKITTTGLKSIPYPKKEFVSKIKSKLYAFAKGTVGSMASGGTKGLVCGNDHSTISGGNLQGTNVIGAVLKPAAIDSAIETAALTTGNSAECVKATDTADKDADAKSRVLEAVCSVLGKSLAKPPIAAESTIRDFQADGRHASITFAAMKGQGLIPQDEEKAEKKQIADFVAAAFGTKESAIAEDFIKPLSANKLSFAGKGKEQKEEANKIAKSTNAGIAIAFFAGKNEKVEATNAKGGQSVEYGKKSDSEDKTGKKKDGDNKTNATDCTGAEEGKCDKTKCDWNAEKKQCKGKDEENISSLIKVSFFLILWLL